MSKHSATGRPWRRLRAAILANNTTCHICGHPGADSIDHITPTSQAPHRAMDPTNLAPAHLHGCNDRRGNKPHTPQPPTTRKW